MMVFATQKDMALATLMTARWLPLLIKCFEEGVETLGFRITEKSHHIDEDGRACPVIVVRGPRLVFRLGLRNAMEDFLTVDREAHPVRVDPHLVEDDYAREKIADIVTGRLDLLKVLVESRDRAEAEERIAELAGRFAWLRAIFVDEPKSENRADEAPAPDSPNPVCKLVGTDGNVFAIIGRVRDALRRAGQAGRASDFVERAFHAGSYDEVLRLCMEYVDVH